MWNVVVLAAMISLVSIYMTHNDENLTSTEVNGGAEALVENMALYRDAVTNYFTQNDVRNTAVSIATLKATGVLPAWSSLYQQAKTPIWSNFRDSNGTIYIYASVLPRVNIVSEMARLSHNSMLVGAYRNGVASLQSPIFGDTKIPVTALNDKSVPDGTPVWIAMTK